MDLTKLGKILGDDFNNYENFGFNDDLKFKALNVLSKETQMVMAEEAAKEAREKFVYQKQNDSTRLAFEKDKFNFEKDLKIKEFELSKDLKTKDLQLNCDRLDLEKENREKELSLKKEELNLKAKDLKVNKALKEHELKIKENDINLNNSIKLEELKIKNEELKIKTEELKIKNQENIENFKIKNRELDIKEKQMLNESEKNRIEEKKNKWQLWIAFGGTVGIPTIVAIGNIIWKACSYKLASNAQKYDYEEFKPESSGSKEFRKELMK